MHHSGDPELVSVISDEVPGLFVAERAEMGFDSFYSPTGKISFRGLGTSYSTSNQYSSRLMILVDGFPRYSGMNGFPYPDTYLTSMAQSVEVVRGPASVFYGSNAMEGVINIITKRAEQDGFNFNAKASYGSFNTWVVSGNAGYRDDRVNVFASINRNLTEGHEEPGFLHFDNAYETTNSYLKTEVNLSQKFDLKVDFNTVHYEAIDTYQQESVEVDHHSGSLTLRNTFDRFRGSITLFANEGGSITRYERENQDYLYGVMAHQQIVITENNRLAVGYDYRNVGAKRNYSSVIEDEWVESGTHDFFAFLTRDLGRLNLSGGLRFAMPADGETDWTPQFDLRWQPFEKTVLGASISRGYRSPSLEEKYWIRISNRKLANEYMWAYEVVWKQQWWDSGMITHLTAFHNEAHNLIVYDWERGDEKLNNLGRDSNSGIEIAWRYPVSRAVQLRANYTWIFNKPWASPQKTLFFGGLVKWNQFTMDVKIQSMWKLYDFDNLRRPLIVEDQFLTIDARSCYRINDQLELFVQGKNLLEASYKMIEEYPMPGYRLFAGVEVRFGDQF